MNVCVGSFAHLVLLAPGSIAACALYIELILYSSWRPRFSLKELVFTKQSPVVRPRNHLLPICLPRTARVLSSP